MTEHWKTHLAALSLVIVAALALLHRDLADMAAIWWSVSTYNHQLFILPIIGWLIWQRRGELAAHQPRSWWWGLLGVALAGIGWALGEAAGIAVFRHAALILLVQSLVVTVLGPTVSRALLFPIFYLVFMLPIGEELVPALQTITAKMCMFLLNLVGIPAHIEGVFITTPIGLFEVAEACSGVKFLVAMVAYAVLAANACFVSWKRRITFLVMAMAVPIFANGFRAFSTIWISELTGSTDFAASFDHIIYGWVFFALVMATVMAIGWRWFDRRIDDPWIPDVKPEATGPSRPWLRAGAAFALFAGLVCGQQALASLGQRTMKGEVVLPEIKGWSRANILQANHWIPRFDGADHRLWGQYVNSRGKRVDLFVALYAWQGEGREIVGYGQGSIDPQNDWSWMRETASPPSGRGEMIRSPTSDREVVSFYWIGGKLTGSATRVKLETLKTRLFGQNQAAVAIFVSNEMSRGKEDRATIDAFLRDLGPPEKLARQMIDEARSARRTVR